MVERMRRLRLCFANTSPGRPGQPSDPTMWVCLLKAERGFGRTGRKSRDQAGEKLAVRAKPALWTPEVRPRGERNRRSGAPRGERPTSLGVRRKAFEMLPAPFGAPLPHVFEGASLIRW